MADGNWDEILAEYKTSREYYADSISWGKDLIWMEKLIPHILSNRDLSKIYPVTSLHVLNLSIGKSWEETLTKPHISIKPNQILNEELTEKYRFEFSLTQRSDEKDVYRLNVESVFCSFEKSLEVFDELFEKLKELTAKNS